MYNSTKFFAAASVLLLCALFAVQMGALLLCLLLALPGLVMSCLGVSQYLTAWRLADEEARAERRRHLSESNRHMWLSR